MILEKILKNHFRKMNFHNNSRKIHTVPFVGGCLYFSWWAAFF